MKRHNHIFISYKREEISFALNVRQALRAENFKVWWDGDLQTGQRWSEELDNALLEADAIIVLWSNESVKSEWVRHEASIGKIRSILTHVKIDDVNIPKPFDSIQAADLTKWDNNEKHIEFQKIVNSIKKIQRLKVRELYIKKIKLFAAAILFFMLGFFGGSKFQDWNKLQSGNELQSTDIVRDRVKNEVEDLQQPGVFKLQKNKSKLLNMPDNSKEIIAVGQIYDVHSYLYITVNGVKNQMYVGESVSFKNSNCKLILREILKWDSSGKFEFICDKPMQ